MRNLPPLERLQQRSRLYLGRARRSLTLAPLRKKCMFMHVPKCGGTSVSESLYATVPLQDKIGILNSVAIRRSQAFLHLGREDDVSYHDEGPHAEHMAGFLEQLVMMYLAERRTLIHGHFLFTDRIRELSQAAGYGYVTVLRDPVERTISNYRMALRMGEFTGDFDAFLDSDMGRRMALHALRFFSGRTTIARADEAAALERARSNLAVFDTIGFMEDMDGFARDFGKSFGNRPSIAHYNKATDHGVAITPAQRDRLEGLCAPDVALTDLARSLFQRAR